MVTSTYIFLNSISKGQDFSKNETNRSRPLDKKLERINVLIVGVDAKNPKMSAKARTDTMMVATFDPHRNQASIISIPRDTRVIIRGHKGKDKINHAHVYGGIDLCQKTVKDLLGIDIHYYIKINYEGLEKIVDDVGGVKVDVPRDMKYDDPYADPPLHINLKKGKQILDGDKAMQFVRYRKGYKGQDLERIKAQHTFLKAFGDKLLQPQMIIKVPKLVDTFTSYVETDMPVSVIMKYALKAKKMSLEDINTVTIPGEHQFIHGVSYYNPNMDKIASLIHDIFKGNFTKTEVSEKTVDEKTTIEVLNGSNIGGLATKTAQQLKREGYNIVNISNVKGMAYSQTHIYDRKNKLKDAKNIAKILKIKEAEVDIDMKSKADITIIVGSDMNK